LNYAIGKVEVSSVLFIGSAKPKWILKTITTKEYLDDISKHILAG
jgi:hypothetical protein